MTKSLCLAALMLAAVMPAGCVTSFDDGAADDAEDLGVADQELINCAPDDLDCTGYPTPPARKPDLVPVNLTAADGRCWWDGYVLHFGVKNTGSVKAPTSKLRLEFSASYGRTYTVPALAPNATYDLFESGLRLDSSCYLSGCTMRVVVDQGGSVAEASESNNTATRRCDFHF